MNKNRLRLVKECRNEYAIYLDGKDVGIVNQFEHDSGRKSWYVSIDSLGSRLFDTMAEVRKYIRDLEVD